MYGGTIFIKRKRWHYAIHGYLDKKEERKRERKDKLSLWKIFLLHLNFLFSSTYIFNVFHKCSPWFPNTAGVFAVKIESQWGFLDISSMLYHSIQRNRHNICRIVTLSPWCLRKNIDVFKIIFVCNCFFNSCEALDPIDPRIEQVTIGLCFTLRYSVT